MEEGGKQVGRHGEIRYRKIAISRHLAHRAELVPHYLWKRKVRAEQEFENPRIFS